MIAGEGAETFGVPGAAAYAGTEVFEGASAVSVAVVCAVASDTPMEEEGVDRSVSGGCLVAEVGAGVVEDGVLEGEHIGAVCGQVIVHAVKGEGGTVRCVCTWGRAGERDGLDELQVWTVRGGGVVANVGAVVAEEFGCGGGAEVA